MDSTTVSRQNTIKKRNKENVQPVPVVKSFIKQNVLKSAPPVQPNGNKTMDKVAPAKQSDRRQVIGEHSLGKTATLKTSATTRKPNHSQDYKNEQAAKFKKIVGEAPKPTALQPPRPAPGMYKGKIIESKIGSIWKSSVPAKSADQKSTAPNAAYQKSGTLTTSAAGRGSKTSTSALNRPIKPTTKSLPNGFSSARPPTRSVPTIVRPKNATMAQSRRCGTLIQKPKVPVTDTKASKPPATSAIRQYRTNGETAEEKKAKLAEWLASKGKTLKRPAMSIAPSTKSKMSNKSTAPPKSQLTTKSKAEPEVKEEPKPASVTPALTADNQEVDKTDKRFSFIMNTTLDLLDNSNLDLPVDPQDGGSDRVDDIVINLCDALEALEPPSRSNNEFPLNECNDMANESKSECKQEYVKNETPDVKSEDSISDDQEVLEESDESDDCYVKENTPPREEASVVKYSVKTTPFLQSVKKTIEDEVYNSTSKNKSNIKDLKFLTPVRRSSRIHRQSSRLPTMLVDHDPCVSSLAELVKLDDDANAYIYRKNPALLEDLPDQPRV